MSSPTPSTPAEARVIVLARDLILASRIRATARALGVEVVMLREPAKLADDALHATSTTHTQTLVVDLNQPGALDAAIAWRARAAPRFVVGFVAHTDAATIRQARDGGLDRVLPRSRFVEELDAILTQAHRP